jgi:hypothetical protein
MYRRRINHIKSIIKSYLVLLILILKGYKSFKPNKSIISIIMIFIFSLSLIGCSQPEITNQTPSNLILNPDFESNFDNWTIEGNNLSIDPDHPVSGSFAVKFSASGTPDNDGVYGSKLIQEIPFNSDNVLLSLSGFGKGYYDSYRGFCPGVELTMIDKNNNPISRVGLGFSSFTYESGEQEYKFSSVLFLTPPGIAKIRIIIEGNSVDESFCNVDCLTLKQQ